MGSLGLRARLTLWCVLVVVAVVACFAVVVLVTQREIGLRRLDRELDDTTAQLGKMLQEEMEELDSPRVAAEESIAVVASRDRPAAVLSDDGSVLASGFGDPIAPQFAGPHPATPGVRTIESQGAQWRLHERRDVVRGTAFRLIVASPLSDLARDQRDVRQAILVGIPLAILIAAGGGLWLASIGLRPVTMMAQRAASLPLTGEDDLGPPARDDEIGQLTQAFNALVARLRAALRTQRQFMADASHELRSPVSVIRTASDVALSREHREEADYREALAMTAAQSRRLGALVDDMLVLARADAGGYPLRTTSFVLDDVVDACQQAVGVLAAARQVSVTTSGAADVTVHADQELLERLLINLLQNAVQHSPAGGAVSVDVAVDRAETRIRVIDGGPGIAAADRDRIFDRFVQLDPSRRSEGAGLGLTIARWIAEAHGGSLRVDASTGAGTTFCLALPAAPRRAG